MRCALRTRRTLTERTQRYPEELVWRTDTGSTADSPDNRVKQTAATVLAFLSHMTLWPLVQDADATAVNNDANRAPSSCPL